MQCCATTDGSDAPAEAVVVQRMSAASPAEDLREQRGALAAEVMVEVGAAGGSASAAKGGGDADPDATNVVLEGGREVQLGGVLQRQEGDAEADADATAIVLEDGREVRLGGLGLPSELRSVIEALASGSGTARPKISYLESRSRLAAELAKHFNADDNEELERHIAVIGRLLEHRNNEDHTEIEYTHMPPRIKMLMKQWDEDETGTLDLRELEDAAKAQQAMKKNMMWLRRVICFLALLVIFLIAAMFGTSLAAAEASKESHVGSDGGAPVMTSLSGEVVQVASSDFAGSTDGVMRARGAQVCAELDAGSPGGCRRLSPAADVPVQVSRATQSSDGLTSAFPDATFHELQTLELVHPGSENQTLQMTITSWQRVAVRSSTCGSVVHLVTTMGRLTLDDRAMSADPQLERHLLETGFESLLAPQGTGGGLGRRLQQTDGMLKGFFNLLRSTEMTCMPQQLEPPEDLLKAFHAKVDVRIKVSGQPTEALSDLFTDSDGNRLPKPGMQVVRDSAGNVVEAYRMWKEEILSASPLEVVQTHSAMQPFLKQVSIARDGAQLRLALDNSTGYRCIVDMIEEEGDGRRLQDEMRMEYMGLVEEAGMILRHFRLHMVAAQEHQDHQRRLSGTFTEADEDNTRNMKAMIKAGIMPTHMDYFDIDSDPSGNFSAGDPYRIRHDSTVPNSRAFAEKTYMSLEPLASADLTVEETFRILGVEQLAHECRQAPGINLTDAMESLLAEVPAIPITTTAGQVQPQTFEPGVERPPAILHSYDKLVQAQVDQILGAEPSEEFLLAESSPAWRAAMSRDSAMYRPELEALVLASETGVNDVGTVSSSADLRRLQSERRLARRLQEAEGGGNLTSAEKRRLMFEFGLDVGATEDGYAFALEIAAGVAGLTFELEFDGNNRIQTAAGTAFGSVPVYSPPTITLTFYGGIAMGRHSLEGFLGLEADVGVFGFGFGVGVAIGAVVERGSFRLEELYGQGYVFLGRITGGVTVVLTPVGCGSNYYRRWEVSMYAEVSRSARWRWLRYSWDRHLFSRQIGGHHGCR